MRECRLPCGQGVGLGEQTFAEPLLEARNGARCFTRSLPHKNNALENPSPFPRPRSGGLHLPVAQDLGENLHCNAVSTEGCELNLSALVRSREEEIPVHQLNHS